MTLLDGARVTDVHCHGFRLDEVRARDQEGFLDRITMLGMCLTSSGLADEAFAEVVTRTTDTSPFAVAMAIRLARMLGCEPTREGLARGRTAALGDALPYLQNLWDDAGVAGLIVDDGYPLPAVDQKQLSRETGLPISRVSRIEPFITELRDEASSYAELEDAFTARTEQALADGAVAFKSVIAYRTGLDVRPWSRSECEEAFRAWRANGWPETREHAKPVRDMLLRRTLAVSAGGGGVPVHVHCGGGDPSIVLAYARPSHIFPLLHEHVRQPIVLIHSGWPWVEEGAFVASILPHVYLDTSLSTPLASVAVDNRLELLLGIAPPAKVLYGSDESTEPEVIWLSAVLARESLERVLGRSIENGYLDEQRAALIGCGVLGDNARRLHGVEAMVA
ncbi:MAG: amidohydrolase [Actinomycetota bacterium]|nr:amidohydrolase [Actinomycetota bacterium]